MLDKRIQYFAQDHDQILISIDNKLMQEIFKFIMEDIINYVWNCMTTMNGTNKWIELIYVAVSPSRTIFDPFVALIESAS